MLLGCDVAFYEANPNGRIDFVKMKSSGMNFVIVRAGQHTWRDSKFAINWEDAKRAGLPRGSYWFYDSRSSPESQAKLWAEVLGEDKGELPLFADYEESYGGTYRGGENFKKFLEETKKLIPNKEIIIYTGFWYFKDNVSSSLHEYFSQYGLWVANYGVSKPLIPVPFKDWLFWQFSEDGNGATYGCSGGLDMNYFNGNLDDFTKRFNITLSSLPEEKEKIPEAKFTHEGVEFYSITRFGTKCFVHVVDTKKAKVFVTPRGNFGTVKSAVKKYSAQIGVNGGGWANVQTPKTITNEVWVSNGSYIQTTAKDDRGFINVSKDGDLKIFETDSNISNLWNVWGFDRILGINGKFNPRIKDTYTKDARTGTGITAEGKLVLLSAEGNDYYQKGLSFPEMWAVLSEFGSVIGGNNDGGSSSQVINTAISENSLIAGSDGKDANVMNHVLIYANRINPENPQEINKKSFSVSKGDLYMKYKVIKSVKARLTPSMYQVLSKTISEGYEFVSEEKIMVSEKIPLIGGIVHNMLWIKMTDGYWIPFDYKGETFLKEISSVVIPVEEDVIFPDEVGIILKDSMGENLPVRWYIPK
jgi:GH25 family lysozyme M1 (1,4-beta-N-acetylmuramidase)/exopolysaccharide biosynthesis protein